MKRTSKYLGKTFGNWKCDHIGIANVQYKDAKRPGKCNYYYCFSRITSDAKCMKKVRLNSTQAALVYRGDLTVEEVANKKLAKRSSNFVSKVDYEFI